MIQTNNRFYFGISIIILGIIALLISSGRFSQIDALVGVALFWGSAFLFARIYLRDDRKWWAVIPAGILFVLGALVIIDAFTLLSSGYQGTVFCLGLALTFLYLWMQRNSNNKLHWAVYPALALTILTILIFAHQLKRLDSSMLVASAIILLGGWLLYKALRS